MSRTRKTSTKILLIGQDYFVIPELARAITGLGIPLATVPFRQDPAFLKELFNTIADFRPGFILTVNHAGLDGEGRVLDLLRRCGTPLASWFVDRPEMYLPSRTAPDALLAAFTWNPDSLPLLKDRNVPHAAYLPLGTDPSVFKPPEPRKRNGPRVSFVGSTWTDKIADLLKAGKFPPPLVTQYKDLGDALESDPDSPFDPVDVLDFETGNLFLALPENRRTMFMQLVGMQATRTRRIKAVAAILPFNPVIVGDDHWKKALPAFGHAFEWWSRLGYDGQLAGLYGSTLVNFNTSSLQTFAAANQRLFDVPACGSFLLTDHPPSLDGLFEPGKEIACYESIEEIPGLVARYLENEKERERIAAAGMKRVLAEHTYAHRVREIVRRMGQWF